MYKFKRKEFIRKIISIVILLVLLPATPIYATEKTEPYTGKLIIIGDSRTRNMSKWVRTGTIETRFVAKSGMGYEWFVSEGAAQVTEIAEAGDTILVWLGVNDYNSNKLYSTYNKSPWELYSEEINYLAKNDWAKFKVCVAGVGYIDRNRILNYYGGDKKSNVAQIGTGVQINGIKDFNAKLKKSLDKSVTWMNPIYTIGISSSDETTKQSLWVKRANGLYDGLHYNKATTQKIYNYFAKKVLALYQ